MSVQPVQAIYSERLKGRSKIEEGGVKISLSLFRYFSGLLFRENGRATRLPKVWKAASIQPQICRECCCQAGNPERQSTLRNHQRSDLRTATQVREVEQLVLLEGFFECVTGLHLVNHPIQVGVVERGAPLLDFLHGGNEWFSVPRTFFGETNVVFSAKFSRSLKSPGAASGRSFIRSRWRCRN